MFYLQGIISFALSIKKKKKNRKDFVPAQGYFSLNDFPP